MVIDETEDTLVARQNSLSREGREQAKRIASIGQQISAPLKELNNQFNNLVDHVRVIEETTNRTQKEYQQREFWWTRFGALSAVAFSFFSLILAFFTFLILKSQLSVQRVDQRAWINLSVSYQPVAENKPLAVIVKISNVGKTPAKVVRQEYVIEKLSTLQPPSLIYVNPHLSSFAAVIPPNSPGDITV